RRHSCGVPWSEVDRCDTDFSASHPDDNDFWPHQSHGLASLGTRNVRTKPQACACSFSSRHNVLCDWITFWSHRGRFRIFERNGALACSPHFVVRPRHAYFTKGHCIGNIPTTSLGAI